MGAALDAEQSQGPRMTTLDPEIDALRAGDEQTFEALARRHSAPMLRLAMAYVRDRETAEDVVQETWITFLRTLDRFQGRSSLRTWLFGILTNIARARRRRESRLVTFTSMLSLDGGDSRRPTVDRARFASDGNWRRPPPSWSEPPDKVLESRETLAAVQSAIDGLPTKLREVIVLRDVAGWDADEVCELLRISPGNQRIRLHRARAAVRQQLEDRLK
jgi:RNA polymerase sigma-70 factor (ECF subfamily)